MADKKESGVQRWDPFRDLDFFGSGSPFRHPAFSSTLSSANRWAPSVDIAENDDQYVITVELAGASKDDVNVEVHDGTLTIRGEKRDEREEKNEKRRYIERSFGSFARSFTLPNNADGDQVAARFQDGVLTVEIAKCDEAKPKSIQVH